MKLIFTLLLSLAATFLSAQYVCRIEFKECSRQPTKIDSLLDQIQHSLDSLEFVLNRGMVPKSSYERKPSYLDSIIKRSTYTPMLYLNDSLLGVCADIDTISLPWNRLNDIQVRAKEDSSLMGGFLMYTGIDTSRVYTRKQLRIIRWFMKQKYDSGVLLAIDCDYIIRSSLVWFPEDETRAARTQYRYTKSGRLKRKWFS